VLAVAAAAGDYRLEVMTLSASDKGGSYEARVEEVRAATDNDRRLVEAVRLYGRSVLASSEGKTQEALALAERAVGLYEQSLDRDHPDLAPALVNLGDLYREAGEY